MVITDALLGEHGVFHRMLEHIEHAVSSLDSLPNLQNRIATFAFALESHAALEDELLFIALESHLGTQGGPLAVMRMEHDQITDLLGKIESASDLDSTRSFVKQMIQITRGHFQKEEQILFHMAHQFLDEEQLSDLGEKWAQRHVPLIGLDMP